MPKINSLLVANRGEIALRIMRTAREMGIRTYAVYSEADRDAPHVRYADAAFCLGPAPSAQSYLRGDLIIQLCLDHRIDAIHPGYGFLSENAGFVEKVTQAGIIFIGPPPGAMQQMGDKISAKQTVKAYGVPLVPGMDEAIEDVVAAQQVADSIGYPVLIKAAAGGGGKGMRIVEQAADFVGQMERAVSEAQNAFGDGSVFIEKYVTSPRHIEIQVLADLHGHTVYLFERECSIQRRHQKLVEEAPSSVLTPEKRRLMGEAAVRVCQSCGYTNAGTVEFLLDDQHQFYFLEMNTRLQVEHPVTEMITGLDLVREQIRIAEGHPLSFTQEDLQLRGHAIEIRVCAEDPANNFLPDTGTLHIYRRPSGAGIRVDDGFEQGMEIPIHYDSMLGKLIVYAPDRQAAIARMLRAIDDFAIVGVHTTLDFCRYVLEHPAFVSGQFDTHFIRLHFPSPDVLRRTLTADEALAAALVSELILNQPQGLSEASPAHPAPPQSAWRLRRRYR
ncbi:MAG: acetyl-CoA carboxylase biotin carboxylase subunit [Bacteroidia bacterium]|nr:acetyl-CoA carboxylase biotin carboxylase subunit [Bacteroidia bacterium]